jgi:hypothetical protein
MKACFMSKRERSKISVTNAPATTGRMFTSRPFVEETHARQLWWGNSSSERVAAPAPARGVGVRVVDGTPPLVVRPKLQLGRANVTHEQEADAVAARVVAGLSGGAGPVLQRIHRFQPSSIGDGTTHLPPAVETAIEQTRGGGQPLAPKIRDPMERAFGADFSGVRIHADAQSDRLNHFIKAKGFTTGKDIYFRRGAYNTESLDGQRVIAHELTHVVQQKSTEVPRKSSEPESVSKSVISPYGSTGQLVTCSPAVGGVGYGDSIQRVVMTEAGRENEAAIRLWIKQAQESLKVERVVALSPTEGSTDDDLVLEYIYPPPTTVKVHIHLKSDQAHTVSQAGDEELAVCAGNVKPIAHVGAGGHLAILDKEEAEKIFVTGTRKLKPDQLEKGIGWNQHFEWQKMKPPKKKKKGKTSTGSMYDVLGEENV